jgi:hypothetical protein
VFRRMAKQSRDLEVDARRIGFNRGMKWFKGQGHKLKVPLYIYITFTHVLLFKLAAVKDLL